MGKKYSQSETIEILMDEKTKDISQLYNSECVNWKGKTTDGIYYSEIIAKELLSSLKEFDNIESISRDSSYKIHNHNQIVIDLAKSNRLEDIFAKRIYGLEFQELGKILDYQIPIRNTNKDKGLKAFDLLSYEQNKNTLYLIELKYLGNNETLLRAMLECYSYLKLVDHERLIDSYKEDIGTAEKVSVKPVVLLVNSENNPCNPALEYEEIDTEQRSMLKALSLALGLKFVTCNLPFIFESYQ